MQTPTSTRSEPAPDLFTPLVVRGVRSRNRVMVSPMCTYSAGPDGLATDFHLVHLGRMALGGAGIVTLEATAVAARGRISRQDLGLWEEAQVPGLRRIADFLSAAGAVPAIQLSHAGRKAACEPAWAGGAPLSGADAWPTEAPSAVSAGPGWQVPEEMTQARIEESIDQWAAAAERAVRAGFEVIELHGAHGYLLHSFTSPLANRRVDAWGGDDEARLAYPVRVVEAVRAAIGPDVALFHRLSAVDGVAGGLELADTVRIARRLVEAGVDLVDVSSGGIVTDRSVDTRIRRGFAFHADLSRAVREQAGVLVGTVGLVVDPDQADALVRTGDTDLVLLGREMLQNPHWANVAAVQAGRGHEQWSRETGWALAARATQLQALAEAGETPMTRFG